MILMVFAYLSFYFFGAFSKFPDSENIVVWDAFWYDSIKTKGYQYFWYMPSNSAFFPLFAYLWSASHLGSIGISIFNFTLFVLSLNLLYRSFNISIKNLLVFISIPSILFFYIPYTESLSFFFCSLFLIGLKDNDYKLIFFGLLIASVTRATAMFFIPSIIMMEILAVKNIFSKKSMFAISIMAAASLLGLLIVVLIQYYQTHEWFAFAKQQMRFWRHKFDLPGFPLVAHGGDNSMWLDGFAFIVGFLSAASCFLLVVKRLFFKSNHFIYENKPFLFSATYLVMITCYSIFFNAKCQDAQTSMDSINRYLFCNPFFLIFIVYIFHYIPFSKFNYIIFCFLLLIGFYLIGFNGDALTFLKNQKHDRIASGIFFAAFFIYINLFYFSISNIYNNSVAYILFTINIALSVYAIHVFITGGYVG